MTDFDRTFVPMSSFIDHSLSAPKVVSNEMVTNLLTQALTAKGFGDVEMTITDSAQTGQSVYAIACSSDEAMAYSRALPGNFSLVYENGTLLISWIRRT